MAHYTLPTNIGFETFTLTRESRNAISESPFTMQRQILTYPGQRWVVDAGLPPMDRSKVDIWRAFLSRLNGSQHTFNLGDPLSVAPKGAVGGLPLVKGAGQTGETLEIDGCSLSVTGWLLAGDYIQIGIGADARLYMVLEDVNTNGSGEATLTLWPKINVAKADNTAIITSNPVGTFRLANESQQFETGNNSFTRISFSAIGLVS